MTDPIRSGYDNNDLVAGGEPIDEINARFYARFQYPWPPSFVRRRLDPTFERDMLSQSVGDWTGDALPPKPRIWIAGCGTNQAVLTAVRFPDATVVGSDVSTASIDASARLAEQLGVTNLQLRVESINDTTYLAEFDHVISTGVIHHNAEPARTLHRISAALRPGGLLELMVYNRYHCMEAIAVQKAVRLLADGQSDGFDQGLDIAMKIVKERPDLVDRMKVSFSGVDQFETAAADALIQPVMYTFTVADLEAMAHTCGLEFVLPCVNQFDQARGQIDWNSTFEDPELRAGYESLPDARRWQVTNLVELDRSPLLWFYLRRVDGTPRVTERDVLESFADTVFERGDTRCDTLLRGEDGRYTLTGAARPYPGRPSDPATRRIVAEFDSRGQARLSDVLADLDIPADFGSLSRLRVRLTTTAFPYLRRVAK